MLYPVQCAVLVLAAFVFACAGCGSEDNPGSAAESIPADLEAPPTALYDPPLDLSGLVGLSEHQAVEWGERQGFQIIRILRPDDGGEADINPTRLTISVDGDGTVVRASQG